MQIKIQKGVPTGEEMICIHTLPCGRLSERTASEPTHTFLPVTKAVDVCDLGPAISFAVSPQPQVHYHQVSPCSQHSSLTFAIDVIVFLNCASFN